MILDLLQMMTLMEINADVCIFGAGAAGISLAREFVRSSTRVCLFEAGGLEASRDQQSQYAGDSIGEAPMEMEHSRLRAFGGSCNLWGGGCIPLAPLDFERRDWVPESGWPISYAELEPYYSRASEVCRLELREFKNGTLEVGPEDPLMEFDPAVLDKKRGWGSPVVFSREYGAQLHYADNIQVYLNGGLLRLEATPSGNQVTHAVVVTTDGRTVRVKAKHFVLACGGLENARLLLQSNTVAPQGLGNTHGNVGRYFQDHPSFFIGSMHSTSGQHVYPGYKPMYGEGSVPPFPAVELSESFQRRERVLGARVLPRPVYRSAPRGLRALRELRDSLKERKWSERERVEEAVCAVMKRNSTDANPNTPTGRTIPHSAMEAVLGAPGLLRAFQRKLSGKPIDEVSHVNLIAFFEQAPNAESRVTLGPVTDANGQRRLQVDWRLMELDRRTFQKAARTFGEALSGPWGSTFKPAPWVTDDAGTPPLIYGTAHHIGTTRMSDSPKDGVVDRNCRVHGVANLHVAGSSVFPTGGWAFPTLTIVALSVRLADRIRKELAETPTETAVQEQGAQPYAIA